MKRGGDTPSEKTLIAIRENQGATVAYWGELIGNTFYYTTSDGGIVILRANIESGTCYGAIPFDQSKENAIFQTVRTVYPAVNDIEKKDSSISVGEAIPDWNKYVILEPI